MSMRDALGTNSASKGRIDVSADLFNHPEVGDVRSGKVFVISLEMDDLDKARSRIDEMCRKLLSNPVIETYSIEDLK